MCRAFRDADSEIEQRVTLIESSVFRTNEQLRLIKQMDQELEEEFKIMQTRLVNIFTVKLKDVIKRLERIVDIGKDADDRPQYTIKKAKYIFVKQHLDTAILDLERWQTRFDPTWKLIMLRSTGPSVDQLIEQYRPAPSGSLSTTSTLRGLGTLRHMVRDEVSSGVSVYLPEAPLEGMKKQSIPYCTAMVYHQANPERYYIVDTVGVISGQLTKNRERILAKNVRALAERLHLIDTAESLRMGMLQCRGFVKRNEGGFRFVFRQPVDADVSRPATSLRAMLIAATAHSLTERISLAKQLARSVSYMHSLGFVHKNIRPETIVGFWVQGRSVALESVFLTGFGQFRAEDGATSLLGDDAWEKNLYRHSDRQGLHPEEEYVMEHDIYTLGVCLLELGLWLSFVAYDKENKAIRNETLTASLAVTELKSALVLLAKDRLPQIMGDKYCDIVVNCLTCLDEDNVDFADKSQFQDESGIQIGVRYIEKVSSLICFLGFSTEATL